MTALQPVPGAGGSGPAYLLFEDLRVEIFLPTQENSIVMRQQMNETDGKTWASGPLSLTEKNGAYRLEDEGKLLYQN
jgi:hypothetical protein